MNSIVSAFELSIELFENCFQVFEPKVCGLSYIVSSFSSVVSPFYCPIDQNLFKIILHIFVSSAPRSKWRPSTQKITQKNNLDNTTHKQLKQYNLQNKSQTTYNPAQTMFNYASNNTLIMLRKTTQTID